MIIEVEVPGLDVTLFFVRDLMQPGVRNLRRGRVWTATERSNLKGLSREDALRIAEAKILFDGAGPWPEREKQNGNTD